MKIRSGFVSNSSSSSFIVRRTAPITLDDKIVLTKEQEDALVKFGFRKTFAFTPEQVPAFHDDVEWKKEKSFLRKKEYRNRFNYGYEVTCNQDEVMTFLIENKIPFIATCHYGHETVIYSPVDDKVYTATNFGDIMTTYGTAPDVLKEFTADQRKPVVSQSSKEWLKKNRMV